MTAAPVPVETEARLHLPSDDLAARLRQLPPAPKEVGRVVLVVARPEVEARLTPGRCCLTPVAGVENDRWSGKERPDPDAQITVMRADVARVIANGQPLFLFGDNLLVELDLSRGNLPTGTRLRVGTALCEVTAKPHTGCGKFAGRFGQQARDLTNSEEFADSRLRGLYIRVVEPGDVGPGDEIRVLSRPDPGDE